MLYDIIILSKGDIVMHAQDIKDRPLSNDEVVFLLDKFVEDMNDKLARGRAERLVRNRKKLSPLWKAYYFVEESLVYRMIKKTPLVKNVFSLLMRGWMEATIKIAGNSNHYYK